MSVFHAVFKNSKTLEKEIIIVTTLHGMGILSVCPSVCQTRDLLKK